MNKTISDNEAYFLGGELVGSGHIFKDNYCTKCGMFWFKRDGQCLKRVEWDGITHYITELLSFNVSGGNCFEGFNYETKIEGYLWKGKLHKFK